MNEPTDRTTTIAAAMADLRVGAPLSLRPTVLVATGLADAYAEIESVIGPLVVAWNGRGVSMVDVASGAEAFEARHGAVTGRMAFKTGEVPVALARSISRRLEGDPRVRIDLDLRGHSAFEQDVWSKALEIPRGEVRPYGWVAAEIGRPKAVRAVGTALGHNPVPLIVPCHRVVRTDGTIGQYSLGGPANKRTILRSEGLDPEVLEDLAARGIRYLGSDTTGVACLPTCRHARRITSAHRVPFRSWAAVEAAGFRACRVCRPVAEAVAA